MFILGNVFLYSQIKQALIEDRFQQNIIYIIILVVAFYSIFSYILVIYINIKILRLRGITTTATIQKATESFTGSPLSTQKMVKVTCTYRVNNQNYTKTFSPSKEYYRKIKDECPTDSQLEVVYDPLKPERCYPNFTVKNYLVN